MTALSELLTEANRQGWSSREIARRAERTGHKLSYASASVYLGGRHGEPTEPVLAAFSDVLNIPIDKLREAAGVPTGSEAPWHPPVEANRLDTRQRRALEELIRSMVTSETHGEERTDGHQDTARMDSNAQPDGLTATTARARAYLKQYLLTDERWPDRALLPPAIIETILDHYSRSAAQLIETGMLSEPIALPTVVNQAAEVLDQIAQQAASSSRATNTGRLGAGPIVQDRDMGDANTDDRPWEQDQYGLAAKRGRNRGRAARAQQDRDAEKGGA